MTILKAPLSASYSSPNKLGARDVLALPQLVGGGAQRAEGGIVS